MSSSGVVILKSLQLKLTFPCTLSVTLKSTGQQSQPRPVINGLVDFQDQTITLPGSLTDSQATSSNQYIFEVYIHAAKGTRLAGEVKFGLENEGQRVEMLEKCPDKNARMKFVLKRDSNELRLPRPRSLPPKPNEKIGSSQAIPKETVKLNLTQSICATKSTPFIAIEENSMTSSKGPDFKRKKQLSINNSSSDENMFASSKCLPSAGRSEKTIQLPKDSLTLYRLEQENVKLQAELTESNCIELEFIAISNKYREGERKAAIYYNHKLAEVREDLAHFTQEAHKVTKLNEIREEVEMEICKYKEMMAKIVNYAVETKQFRLSDELEHISQMTI